MTGRPPPLVSGSRHGGGDRGRRGRAASVRCRASLGLLAAGLLGGCGAPGPVHGVVPVPVAFEWADGDAFVVTDSTPVRYDPGDAEARRLAAWFSDLVGSAPERALPVAEAVAVGAARQEAPDAGAAAATIRLTRTGSAHLGPEAYELTVAADGATVRAAGGAGLFYGLQTLRQLLPPRIEYTAARPRALEVSPVHIEDGPRFEWRGAMLDVARHFRTPAEVRRFIDLMTPYKLNRLHLHLSDDQGWRIEIPGWPELTRIGGSTEVGGGPGGFYTLAEYAELVRYADERFVTIVPEIDVPGHTNAALASYPELNCDGVAPALYTGIEVGFSALCHEKEITWRFLDDVVGAIAGATTGPWFHVGGDEVRLLSREDYVAFIERVQGIVHSHGKTLVGWDEAAAANLAPGSLVQLWRPLWPGPGQTLSAGLAEAAAELRAAVDRSVAAGSRVILSPADRAYLDMKYEIDTDIGLTWAGRTSLRTAYDWDPSDLFGGIPLGAVAGVEATLWSETLGSMEDVEFMAFPRLAAVAELGWSPRERRSWDDFRARIAAHGPRWQAMGVNFRRAPGVEWPR